MYNGASNIKSESQYRQNENNNQQKARNWY